MDHYQITRFEIKDAHHNNAVLLVTGPLRYKAILQRAFKQYYFSRTFEDRFGRYEWGTYIYNIDISERERVETLLQVFQETVCIEDDLAETFALGYHTQMNPAGGYVRTDFGNLVYQAKPYRGNFTKTRQRAADEIAEQMAQFMKCHPTYARAEIVAAIPSSATNQPNLPVYLAERLADHLGKENGTDLISKTRSTHPMKDCRTIQEKINNVKGAFALDHQGTARMQDRSIILLDDIYQTGFTLNEVGYVLLASGVREVLGLVATKTAQDLE
jgi:pyrimidine operon attenuation protein/uracil phosphoribosyltransferase